MRSLRVAHPARPAHAATRSRSRSATSRFGSSGRSSREPSAARMQTRFVSVPKPDPASATSLATSRSTPLRSSLSPARSSEPVSAAKPTSTGRGTTGWAVTSPVTSVPRTIRTIWASTSGVDSSSRVRPAPRWSLRSAACFGRKSATAAAMTSASNPAAPSGVWVNRKSAALRSAVESTRTMVAPAGRGTSVFAATIVTVAPRSRAAAAIAAPIRPVERFPMYRTGSMASRVPPADTTTCRPVRSASRGAATMGGRWAGSGLRTGRSPMAATTASTIDGSSASRPTPVCPEASSPAPGSTMV